MSITPEHQHESGEQKPVPSSSDVAGHQDVTHAVVSELLDTRDPLLVMRELLGITGEGDPTMAEFSSAEWMKIKNLGNFVALTKAKELQLPEIEINRFFFMGVLMFAKKGRHDVAFRLAGTTGVGSEELKTYLGNKIIEMLFANGRRPTQEEVDGMIYDKNSQTYHQAMERIRALPAVFIEEIPTEDPDKFNEELADEEEGGELFPIINISPSMSMKEMWHRIDEMLTEEKSDILIADVAHDAKSWSSILLVDARFMECSVTEFCAMEHQDDHGEPIEIDLQLLQDLLPVRFID